MLRDLSILNSLIFGEVSHDPGDASAYLLVFILIVLIDFSISARLRELLSCTALRDAASLAATDTVDV